VTEPPLHTGVEGVHVHPPRTGRHWVDMAIAVSAITISVVSLFVAVENGRTERKLVAANSWPFLVYSSQQNGLVLGSRTILLRVQNSGVGPARIQSVVVRWRGAPVRTRGELLSRCCGMPGVDIGGQIKLGLVTQNPIVGVLPARDEVDFLALRERPDNAAIWSALNAARDALTFDACYCSVLDECWRTDLRSTTTPRPVEQCSSDASGYQG
jgi:hypothetical protein